MDNGCDEVRELLMPYLGKIREAITSAWEAWESLGMVAPLLKLPLVSRTRANFLYDHITFNIRVKFEGVADAEIIETRGFLELRIKGIHVLRFKKLDGKGRSRNIMTQRQRSWFAIQYQLFGSKEPLESIRLIAGYQLNLLGTELTGMLITKPSGVCRIDWAFPIPEPEATAVLQMPARPTLRAVVRSDGTEKLGDVAEVKRGNNDDETKG
jgi:hypothetical protein